MPLKITALTEHVGSRIDADRAALLDGSLASELRALLEERGVLTFPRIDLTDEEQRTFARLFGTPAELGERGVHKISLDANVTAMAHYLKGTTRWHFDGWNDAVPARGTILTGRVLSETGGQTEFSNTYAAFEALSDQRKAALAGLKVAHTMMATQRGVFDTVTPEMEKNWWNFGVTHHPLIWLHRSGRRSLLLGSSADWIVGLDRDESEALLRELREWARQPRFVYRHEWQTGDMIVWDNCGVLHRVEPYPATSGRVMHRITLEGEEAIA